MVCRYRYSPSCGEVALRVHVTVNQSDASMRETSRRLMCRSCAEWLSGQPDTTVHSMVYINLSCHRTACKAKNPTHQHTQTNEVYCAPCARRINEHHPGLVIRMTEEHLQNALALFCAPMAETREARRARLQRVVDALDAQGFGPAYIDPCSGEIAFKATVYWDPDNVYNDQEHISPPSNLVMEQALALIQAAWKELQDG